MSVGVGSHENVSEVLASGISSKEVNIQLFGL